MPGRLAAGAERHPGAASGGRIGAPLPAVHQRGGPVRPQRTGHRPYPGIPARNRVPGRLQLQVRPQSAAGAAAGRQSHRMRPFRTQTPDSFQTLPRRPHRKSLPLPPPQSSGRGPSSL